MKPRSGRFITNYAVVLGTVAADPSARQRDIAERTGLTERAVSEIVQDLAADG